jgi:2-keto-4-pentenoate hydratase/2-oxohepta-3-ene-1,7-dioic acid hydratase in catechol pathway
VQETPRASATSEYRLVSYRAPNARIAAGILVDDRVHPAQTCLADADDVDASSVLGLLQTWDRTRALLAVRVAGLVPADGIPLAEVALEAPILYPSAIFLTWGNYADHNREMAALAGRPAPVIDTRADPFFVMKSSAHSVIGPGAPIRYPAITRQLDYEAELGVVIGRPVRDVAVEAAAEAIAGFVIVNDLSARDLLRRDDERMAHLFDWLGQKCFEDSAPMGPWFTPAQFVANPSDLRIKLWVNGNLKQDGRSSDMVYSIAENIAYLSRRVTLRPGDVIATGCPAGVGVARGEFLEPGDEIRIEIDGCGVLVNRVVAA